MEFYFEICKSEKSGNLYGRLCVDFGWGNGWTAQRVISFDRSLLQDLLGLSSREYVEFINSKGSGFKQILNT